jgi:hypothetical protein
LPMLSLGVAMLSKVDSVLKVEIKLAIKFDSLTHPISNS